MNNDELKVDLLLLHAPAYFDFRKERKIYFPFMSTSGDVPITPVYEFIPLGFKTLQEYIKQDGHEVKILNLCSLMLQNPDMDLEECFKNIEAKIIGIDLHWMVHVQGALEIAAKLKKIHKDTFILFGGISSTYYAEELITYPFIDMVMRGYDTHMPMSQVVSEVKTHKNFQSVPNLIWKNKKGEIIDNPVNHMPTKCSNGVNWSDIPQSNNSLIPMLDIVSTTNVGCANNCGWCGGSNKAFKRLYKDQNSPIFKDRIEINKEFESLKCIKDIKKYNFYSCGNYNQSDESFMEGLDQIEKYKFKSINYEQYSLQSKAMLKRMVHANSKTIITLSPESHDIRISKLSGRGNYSMEQMEIWIDDALNIGIDEINIWFFIGMPEQDEKSVFETIKYCDHLLKRFKGSKVIPLICPLIPFLDPASNFFENSRQNGYKIFYRTVEEHRKGMMRASIINRLNYETKWLSREQIVKVGYKAIKELFMLKGEYNLISNSIVESLIDKLDDALEFIDVVHKIDNIINEKDRNIELQDISEDIYRRNQEVFFKGVLNQAFPVMRKHGQRWFDYV
ncbi:cobalamin-dependent protein [Clostridium estertheticum]|uniref:cobalamin-dependent protein n=1 Tax=Clostridium estertheticum TaxID=238834 RepID=UPI0013EE9C81|nr:cobalamin-dependent protein [Clostridium estertheticum]MBZ9609060.1 cobalamin-dependent protein [Clostridium estertheticum]